MTFQPSSLPNDFCLGFWSLDYGLRAANVTGLVMLALLGVFAGVVTQETWPV